MKAFGMVRLGVAIAGVLLAGTVLAQEPGGGMGQGFGSIDRPWSGLLAPRALMDAGGTILGLWSG